MIPSTFSLSRCLAVLTKGATAIALTGKYAELPHAIVVDKPFVYFIRAGKNGLIHFAGVVNNPKDK